MMRYDYKFLQSFCQENNIELLQDYSQEIVTSKKTINIKCKNSDCNEVSCKGFAYLTKSKNFFCKTHNDIIKYEKGKETCLKNHGVEFPSQSAKIKQQNYEKLTKYNYKYLLNFCKENDIVLLDDYSNENLNVFSNIKFKCCNENCNEECNKKIQILIKYKNFGCKTHRKNYANKKRKITCIDKYNCESPLQNPEIKEQIKKTNIEKYGCEYACQNTEIKEQIKKTNIEKYGCEYVSQNKNIQLKIQETCLKNHGVRVAFLSKILRNKSINTNLSRYGVPYPTQCEYIKNKTRNTNLRRYGVLYVLQSPEIKTKIIKTNICRYGDKCASKTETVKNKTKQTCFLKFGINHTRTTESIEKTKNTNLKRYGCICTLSNKYVNLKTQLTNLKRYNVKFAMQNAEIAERASKTAYKSKPYVMPSGKQINLQGYEHFAMNYLLNEENIAENDIVTERTLVPVVWYKDATTKKDRRYFVDILIPSQKRCIEVKSSWTFQKKRDNVLEKQNAVKLAGYECEIWVFDAKGELVECHK